MCIQWVARLTRNVEVVGSSPIKGPRCLLVQETLPVLITTGWFQERIRAWYQNRTKINWGPYGRLTWTSYRLCNEFTSIWSMFSYNTNSVSVYIIKPETVSAICVFKLVHVSSVFTKCSHEAYDKCFNRVKSQDSQHDFTTKSIVYK